ncbi:MAG: hypothetical protein GY793_03670, partial [Proteobacteria bacterium]|nr:hypothetical protein [Pseudomonadota bacterium]
MMSLVVVTVLSLLMLGYFATEIIYSSLYEARRQKVQDIVETSLGVADVLNKEVISGKITKKRAIAKYRAITTGVRYGDDDYIFSFDTQGVIMVHPIKPQLNGENLYDFKDKTGVQLFKLMIDEAKKGGGYVKYFWPKGSSEELYPKISYAEMFSPWNMVVSTGIYIDDVEEEYKAAVTELAKIASIFIILAIALVLIISKNITGALN